MPSKTRRVLRNTIVQVVGQGITWTLSCVLLILLPRYLGDACFGKFSFALGYCGLFSTLVNLGVNTFLVKEVSILHIGPEFSPEENASRAVRLQALLGNVLSLKLLLAVGVFLLQTGVIYCLPKDDLTRQAVLIVGLGACLGGITQTLGGVFQGMENMMAINSVLVVEKTIVTGGCALLLGQGWGLLPVCWAHTAAAGVSFILNLVLLGRRVRIRLAWELPLLRRVFTGGFPFLIWVVFSEIYLRVGVLMLSLLTTDAVVGWYGASTRIYATLLFAPTILANSVFPVLMRMGAGAAAVAGEEVFARAAERLMNMLLFVAIPISAGLTAVAGPLTRLLYGAGPFEHAAENLRVLGASLLLVCVDILLGTVLIARGKEKPWARMAVAAAIFNPLANLALIPLADRLWGNGGIGASIATLLTEALMMAGALWLMPKGIFSRRNLVLGVKGCLLGTAMVLLLRAWAHPNLFGLIGAGAAFYLPLAFLLGLLPREDVAHLWHAVRRRADDRCETEQA